MAPIQHFAAPAGLKAPPLSFATRVGDLLFVSGIPGFDEKGALRTVSRPNSVLSSATSHAFWAKRARGFPDLVKVNVLLNARIRCRRDECIISGAFGPPPYPARTTCVVQALPDPAMLIEIECIASLGGH